jgi:hypothetical protein
LIASTRQEQENYSNNKQGTAVVFQRIPMTSDHGNDDDEEVNRRDEEEV